MSNIDIMQQDLRLYEKKIRELINENEELYKKIRNYEDIVIAIKTIASIRN